MKCETPRASRSPAKRPSGHPHAGPATLASPPALNPLSQALESLPPSPEAATPLIDLTGTLQLARRTDRRAAALTPPRHDNRAADGSGARSLFSPPSEGPHAAIPPTPLVTPLRDAERDASARQHPDSSGASVDADPASRATPRAAATPPRDSEGASAGPLGSPVIDAAASPARAPSASPAQPPSAPQAPSPAPSPAREDSVAVPPTPRVDDSVWAGACAEGPSAAATVRASVEEASPGAEVEVNVAGDAVDEEVLDGRAASADNGGFYEQHDDGHDDHDDDGGGGAFDAAWDDAGGQQDEGEDGGFADPNDIFAPGVVSPREHATPSCADVPHPRRIGISHLTAPTFLVLSLPPPPFSHRTSPSPSYPPPNCPAGPQHHPCARPPGHQAPSGHSAQASPRPDGDAPVPRLVRPPHRGEGAQRRAQRRGEPSRQKTLPLCV